MLSVSQSLRLVASVVIPVPTMAAQWDGSEALCLGFPTYKMETIIPICWHVRHFRCMGTL